MEEEGTNDLEDLGEIQKDLVGEFNSKAQLKAGLNGERTHGWAAPRQIDPSGEGDTEALRVFLRIRPLLSNEGSRHYAWPGSSNAEVILDEPPPGSAARKARKKGCSFQFSKVFDEHANQETLFNGVAEPVLTNVLHHGKKAAVIFLYGVSGSGKTYSVQGNQEEEGLLPRAIERIFEETGDTSRVRISACEIYNEVLRDLLHDKKRHNNLLRLQESADSRMKIENLERKPAPSVMKAKQLALDALSRRYTAETSLNQNSSRGHCIITVDLEEHGEDWRSISFVDLAGSERGARADSRGERSNESGNINKSLYYLNRCLSALKRTQNGASEAVTVRESKLTHLFKDALQGRGSVTMCVTISPSRQEYDETRQVLKLASLASRIKTISFPAALRKEPAKPFQPVSEVTIAEDKIPERTEDYSVLAELQNENARLRSENENLHEQMVDIENSLREEIAEEFADVLRKKDEESREIRAEEQERCRYWQQRALAAERSVEQHRKHIRNLESQLTSDGPEASRLPDEKAADRSEIKEASAEGEQAAYDPSKAEGNSLLHPLVETQEGPTQQHEDQGSQQPEDVHGAVQSQPAMRKRKRRLLPQAKTDEHLANLSPISKRTRRKRRYV